MPGSKGKFDAKWMDVFRWFELNPEKPYAVECEDISRCNTLRTEFYRARSTINAADFPNTMKRETTIEDTAVYFRTRKQESVAELLARSLAQIQEKND